LRQRRNRKESKGEWDEKEADSQRPELTATQQQKQIEALTATVQKVSEKIELNKTTPQLVADRR